MVHQQGAVQKPVYSLDLELAAVNEKNEKIICYASVHKQQAT